MMPKPEPEQCPREVLATMMPKPGQCPREVVALMMPKPERCPREVWLEVEREKGHTIPTLTAVLKMSPRRQMEWWLTPVLMIHPRSALVPPASGPMMLTRAAIAV